MLGNGGRKLTIHESQRHSFFLTRLTTCTSNPAKNDAVDAVCANRKDAHGEIACAEIQCRACENEAEDSNALGDRDVPEVRQRVVWLSQVP
jgi:hypothetical protein